MAGYTIDPQAEYERIGAIYTGLATMIDTSPEAMLLTAPDVSAWSVGQQVEHTLIATGMMLKAPRAIYLGRGQDQAGPNRVGEMVMRTERVRRGRAKAPENTVPTPTPSQETLQKAWARSKRSYDALGSTISAMATAKGRLEHPYLGWLNAVEWLRIVRVHAEHHLRIIADIKAKAS
ncbi:MAG: DinB family protein [Bacteroidota bacterium]